MRKLEQNGTAVKRKFQKNLESLKELETRKTGTCYKKTKETIEELLC